MLMCQDSILIKIRPYVLESQSLPLSLKRNWLEKSAMYLAQIVYPTYSWEFKRILTQMCDQFCFYPEYHVQKTTILISECSLISAGWDRQSLIFKPKHSFLNTLNYTWDRRKSVFNLECVYLMSCAGEKKKYGILLILKGRNSRWQPAVISCIQRGLYCKGNEQTFCIWKRTALL